MRLKRIWGIRHVRFLYHAWLFRRWTRLWSDLGYVANRADLDYLDAIWKGDA